MKKSNRILIGIFLLATGWIITYNFLIASVTRTISDNGVSKFGHLSQSADILHLKPFTRIQVFVDGSPKIYITQSDTHELSIGDGYSKYLVIENKNGTLFIHINKPLENTEEILHIKVPEVNDIVINQKTPELENQGAFVLYLNKLKATKLNLTAFYPMEVEFRNCNITNLGIQGKLCTDYNFEGGIKINPTNHIDSLRINLEGKGILSISKAGEMYNMVNLSDSIQLEAGMPVLRKVLNK